ncbi:STAS-like domain-containing protein [Pantoea agglomerans]|uniref:STAS-like domain-containing protein n=1 Tax=Enterobacter agglomerans TaxID=549 RepID=UPI00177E991D|nr:STAS-like domain-containing protein [Pantoea agglomerans]WVL88851.1 STAS-like domain-containing protein [Pantoea agglomerans]
MNIIDIRLPGGDLASRHLAIDARHNIEKYIKKNNIVFLDLSNVESISESYSDELFGILAAKNGVTSLLSHLKIKNANASVLLSIATVMKRRADQRSALSPA